MRCVYFGLPRGAIALSRAGHEVVAAVLGRRPNDEERRDLAREAGPTCPWLLRPSLDAPVIASLLTGAGAALGVCYLYPRLIPGPLVRAFPDGVLSVHPSLLPRHRGADPYFWALWAGDPETGVTVLRLDEGVDSGPVLARRALGISSRDDVGTLSSRLDTLALDALLDEVDRWEREGPREGIPQDPARATEAPAPDDDLLALRWDRAAETSARLVRAASPDPGAFLLDSGGEPIIVLAARATNLDRPGALRPGDVIRLGEGVTVWTVVGGLVLEAVQRAGETPRREAATIAKLFPGIADLR